MDHTSQDDVIAGCRTRFMRGGSGSPLVFLHGASGAASWLPFMDQLAEHREIIVPEHPGFGNSDHPDWLDGISDLAYFYLDTFEQLGLVDIDLVGASIGGWLAAEIAIRNSSRLRSLTLVGPAGIHVKGLRKADIFMWSAEETARNLFYDQRFSDEMLAVPLTPEAQMAVLKNKLATAKLAWQPRLYNPDLHKWLHRIDVPTLIVWGQEDKVFPPAYGEHFRSMIPGSRLETIAKCGHLPQVEQADRFATLVSGFIQEVAR